MEHDYASPLISVCIPVYNCELYIGAAIESVLAQTCGDFELVILNNCSTDRTAEVIRSFRDPRIRTIDNATNIGAEGNWNKALAEARGRYVKIVCADDLLHPSCLERQVAVLEDPAYAGVVMVCCGREVIDARGKKLLSRSFARSSGRLAGQRAIRRTIRAGGNLIGEPTAVLFRRSVLPRVGNFSIAIPYVIDLDFWCRMLLEGDLFFMHEELCAFRVSANSWSVQVADSQSNDFCSLIHKLSADPRFGLSPADRFVGGRRAVLNKWLRQMFYKFLLR